MTEADAPTHFTPDSSVVSIVHPSPNINDRRGDTTAPTLLIMHYTGLATVEDSIRVLSDPACQVSCHYVIDDSGVVTQMVPEDRRAWHAGVSHWQGQTDINSLSIGIEIQNPGHDAGYPDFPEAQMENLLALAKDIVVRNAIQPRHVLAHSDIAPQRKNDPGEKFDWKRLWQAGIGHWVEPVRIAADNNRTGPATTSVETVIKFQHMLKDYGYGCSENGELDAEMTKVVIAFQRHFRPACVDGNIDKSTYQTLEALLDAL